MRLLIIGSLNSNLTEAGKIAINRGAKVGHAENIDAAMISLRSGKGADLIMIDVDLPIHQLVNMLETERFNIPIVACGVGENSKDKAVYAIRSGAKEYIPLPPDPELIATVLEAVSEDSNNLLYKDKVMDDVINMADKIAKSDASVLITGESGTGKEVISRHIHNKSKRKSAHFISVNCAAIPEHLLESELFGHEKGAFTGAVARRVGKFEEANGGTLLLDEISEMPIHLQAKLLRAIQERVIDPLGSSRPVKVDIRLLATSNRDLWQSVKKGDFREDLYFRLNVINIAMPPLRDRPNDIIYLAKHFNEKFSKLNDLPIRILSKEAEKALTAYHWPGNVRELENMMHRTVLMASGLEISETTIFPQGIPHQKPQEDKDDNSLVGKTVAEVEKNLIIDTLDHCLGNRTHAANVLGISLRTLRNKLKQYEENNQL